MFSKKFFDGGAHFSQLPQSEDCESVVPSPKLLGKQHPYRLQTIPLQIAIYLFFATFMTSGILGLYIGSLGFKASSKSSIERVSKFAPLLKDIDITFRPVQFAGSLLKENIYRQNASDEVDAAWVELGVDYRASIIPVELAQKSGLTPDQVQVSEKYGGGYPANVEGLHHLHCLNLLRQALYYNFDYYHALGKGAFKNDDGILRLHVTHCLDILRQQLMCTIDIGVLGQVWWNQVEPKAYPDFNTKHICRNFEEVRKWAETHQAPEKVPDDFLQPPQRISDISKVIP